MQGGADDVQGVYVVAEEAEERFAVVASVMKQWVWKHVWVRVQA